MLCKTLSFKKARSSLQENAGALSRAPASVCELVQNDDGDRGHAIDFWIAGSTTAGRTEGSQTIRRQGEQLTAVRRLADGLRRDEVRIQCRVERVNHTERDRALRRIRVCNANQFSSPR